MCTKYPGRQTIRAQKQTFKINCNVLNGNGWLSRSNDDDTENDITN